MNILVLGSAGQIGVPFCSYARKNGHTIVELDLQGFYSYDLRDPLIQRDLFLRILDNKIEKVVFLAFDVGGSKYLQENDSSYAYIQNNVLIMANVFAVLKKSKIPFLFASSQMSNMFHTNYGFLKNLGERYTKSLDGAFCRFWNVYGYENPRDKKSHVITDLIFKGLTKNKIDVVTTGEEKRQFLFVDDCSRAVLMWCENKIPLRCLDISSFSWVEIREVAAIISKTLNVQLDFGEKKDVLQGVLNEPSGEILKFWSPEVTLTSGIDKIIHYQKDLLGLYS